MDARHKRFKEAREALRLSQTEMSKRLGKTQAFVSVIERGLNWTTDDALEKIERVLGISKQWLETGEGEMLIKDRTRVHEAQPGYGTKGTVFTALQKHGEKLARQTDNLKILVVQVNKEGDEWVRVVPEFALGSYSEWGYRDQNFMRDNLPVETVPEDLRNRGTVAKFQIYGDSMSPTIRHKDWVYCTYLQMTSEQEFRLKFRDDHIYVLNSRVHGVIVKRLRWNRQDPTIVMAFSDNEDQSQYEPFPININDIQEWWYWHRTYSARGDKPEREKEVANMLDAMQMMENNISELKEQLNAITKLLPGK